MRDALIVAGAVLLAITVIAGGLLVVTASPPPSPVILAEDVTFPDYSSGHAGMNGSNEVWFHVEITTLQPWPQGQQEFPQIQLTAEPGSGVADVNVSTFFLDVGKGGVRGFLLGDLDLMRETSTNHWTTDSGPMLIWPNWDMVGSDLYLTFQLSLNVDYANGSAYGYGGWNPAARLPISIAPDPIPWAIAVAATGIGGAALMATGWTRHRRGSGVEGKGVP